VDLETADFRVLAWLKGRVKTSERLEDAAMRATKGRRAHLSHILFSGSRRISKLEVRRQDRNDDADRRAWASI
jgi:hypothetical protein